MWYHAVEENSGRRSCMEYNKRISAIAPGDEVEGYYILKAANPKVAANGKPP